MILAVDILEPLSYGFFRRGLTVAVLAGALCGLMGVYVVLRSLSYIGHGLSHAVFGGAAAASVANVNYFLGAGVWGIASGLLIGRVTRRKLLSADAAIGDDRLVETHDAREVGRQPVEVVGRQDDRETVGIEIGQQVKDLVAGAHIDARSGFVEHKEIRLAG